ncbi:MAG: hypothetical protein ACR2N7_00170 [Acidimicrobiia bacterium]
MTDQSPNHNPADPIVAATKRATVHFAKAAFEVASGVGALFAGITQTVRRETHDEDPESGPQKVTVE